MRFHEIVVAQIQGGCSLKIFKLFAEGVVELGETAAVHSQCVILFLNMRYANPIHVGHTGHNRLFSFDNFRRAVPASSILGE
jgi:hypothetical protein